METKTHYFQNCLGVFQGGGCRGAAFVGAYKEAVKRGVSFSELVGTSAGSIIAVLIGAGATPSQLEEIIGRLDFKKFLIKPHKIENYKVPIAAPIVYLYRKDLFRIISKLGVYDSSRIQEWLDTELKKLVNKTTSVQFKDLIIPTTVVATDLKTQKVKLYGSYQNEEELVAECVRYSCNIPIFFQPINNRYVDGGLLSNLPSFVFKDRQHSSYEKVLAFSLKSTVINEKSFETIKEYLATLASTAIDGSVDIQLALQTNIHVININTGDIEATDFDKMDEKKVKFLLESGVEASKSFFDNESANIKNQQTNVNIFSDYFKAYNEIANSNAFKVNEVIISDTETSWIYDLFPTMLGWKLKNAKITVLLKENNDDPEHGPYRKRLLSSLGCKIIEIKNLPIRGVIVNGDNIYDNAFALIYDERNKSEATYHSKLYQNEEDFKVISILRDKCLEVQAEEKPYQWIKSGITIESVDSNSLFLKLKNVKQYNNSNVKFELHEIDIKDLIFITKYVRGFKFRQINQLFNIYKINNISPFLPAKLNLPDGKSTLICPPILEKIGDTYYVIEGNTRLTYAYKNGIDRLFCIVVSDVSSPLPSSGKFKINEVLITDKEKLGEKRYLNFNYAHFRKIESAIRNPKTCLSDSA